MLRGAAFADRHELSFVHHLSRYAACCGLADLKQRGTGMWAFPYRATCSLRLLLFRRVASVVSIVYAYYWAYRTTMLMRMIAVPGHRASWIGDLARNRWKLRSVFSPWLDGELKGVW